LFSAHYETTNVRVSDWFIPYFGSVAGAIATATGINGGGASSASNQQGSSAGELWSQIDAPLTLWTIPEVASVGATAKNARAWEEEKGGAHVDKGKEGEGGEGKEGEKGEGVDESDGPADGRAVPLDPSNDSSSSGQEATSSTFFPFSGSAGGYSTESKIIEGFAYFKDMARGRLSGDLDGFLKVVAMFDGPEQHTIIGVHIMGEVSA
jgi:hypothetical protein